ncbi:Chitobiosyldiphosphodolichol beta-mannosyltransferase [Penicillium diatomitis]|uniref:Chitobiosyldiphosphodolichol beta-mannosyltransferase n=1 Tax=Penicillium diatomitis TaxID=2819901 RepID=A0A9W9X389_9EURO|nr:Chitobiosyldiphosphodolichol beta-mannosyltransferase [Penicillium diatomitis]KAJ5483062.1 Chitobiosyldiphosphodolichol beta-mannosyltransferase [Penicillium diatomitis]
MIESLISIAFCLSSLLTLIILLLPSQYEPSKKAKGGNGTPRPTVQILVLGDIGRSPRMQYHALSVARKGGKVDIIGYQESDPHPEILTDPNITIVPLRPHPPFLQTSNKILFILYGPLKVLFQVAYLWKCLAYTTAPAQWMIVQNPPSIPTLVVASVSCFLRHTRLIIDWHNFGYSILALKLGRNHPLVKVSTWYERTFAQSASVHFCVTDAMGSVLKDQFNLRAPILTLHDRPANHFHPIQDPGERKKFLVTLPGAEPLRELLESGGAEVLVSSTSWTPDEDFSVLIEALQQYSEQTENEPCLPHILAVITGKGPQKEMYMRQIAALEAEGKLKKVTIRTAWLTVQDYAQLLASASLGVSLHTSSSGVDLPMKVVDMFGAGLPVVGWNRFKAWPELVTEGVNGMGFGSAAELTDQLVTFFKYPQQLNRLRTGAQMESGRRWEDEWDPIAGTLLGLT